MRTWENGMNFEVWKYLGTCGSCGGKVVYKYGYTGRPEVLLKVYAATQMFRYYEGNNLVHSGLLTDLITYLNTI